jgi:hypothetical protein
MGIEGFRGVCLPGKKIDSSAPLSVLTDNLLSPRGEERVEVRGQVAPRKRFPGKATPQI